MTTDSVFSVLHLRRVSHCAVLRGQMGLCHRNENIKQTNTKAQTKTKGKKKKRKTQHPKKYCRNHYVQTLPRLISAASLSWCQFAFPRQKSQPFILITMKLHFQATLLEVPHYRC